MDYFTELLESYSRLKQRKLVLLEKKAAAKKAEVKKPDKIIQEYSREQVQVAALKTPVSYPPYNEAAFHPIPGLVTKDEEGNEKEVLAYQSPPAKRKKGEEGGVAPIQRSGTTWGATSETAPRAQTGGAQHGKIVAWAAGRGGNTAVIINADGSPNEPAFTTWYEKYFLGKEAIGQTDGTGLEAALNRVGESLSPIFKSEKVPDSIQTAIFTQIRSMLALASDLVIAARDVDKGYARSPWAGWKEGEEGESGKYVGRGEDNSDDPEMTRSVGSYISGRSQKSLEYQLAHGKTVEFDPDAGVIFDNLVKDPILIQGALDSVQAFMELGKPEVANRETKCKNIGKRVKKKGDRLVFFRHEDPNQGIAIKQNDMFKFIESQIEKLCGQGIKAIPQGTYTPQQLNDMRGKGSEHGAVAVGIFSNIMAMPEGKKKEEISKKLGTYLQRELLADEKRFSAAFSKLKESIAQGVAFSIRASFVADAMEKLNALTDTPAKLRAFLQRTYDMEAPVVKALQSKFTFPIGLETGIGYADDLAYAFLDEGAAEKAAKKMKLKGRAVHSVTVAEIKKTLKKPELGEIFQDLYDLDDDAEVFLIGSSQKSYFEDGELKFGETVQRSAAVHGTVEGIAPGFEKITQERLGIDEHTLSELREYQNKLDAIDDDLSKMLPEAGNVGIDSLGNQQPINFNTITTMITQKANSLALDDDTRSRLLATIQDYQGQAPNLNGPDNVIQRAELKNELSRMLTNATQFQDITNIEPTEEEKEEAKNLEGKDKVSAEDLAALRVRRAKYNLAYSIQLTGGTLRDGILNKKVFDDNTVRAGSHMAPLMTATLGLINNTEGHKVKVAKGLMSLTLIDPDGGAVSYGSERTRTSQKAKNLKGEDKGMPITRYVCNVNRMAQAQEDAVGLEETVDVGRTKGEDPSRQDNSLMLSFLQGQAKLLERLLINT